MYKQQLWQVDDLSDKLHSMMKSRARFCGGDRMKCESSPSNIQRATPTKLVDAAIAHT